MSKSLRPGWVKAKGSCGFNVAGPVYAAFLNGNALYAFQTSPDWFYGVVGGHGSTGGKTLTAAMASAERWSSEAGIRGSDNRITKKKFAAIVANPKFEPI